MTSRQPVYAGLNPNTDRQLEEGKTKTVKNARNVDVKHIVGNETGINNRGRSQLTKGVKDFPVDRVSMASAWHQHGVSMMSAGE